MTTAATCTAAGVKTYTCSNCGQTKTETIAALGHNYVGGTCTNCGDTVSVGNADTLYLKPASNWKEAGARFAAYFFEGDKNTWGSMTDNDGDGVYEVDVPDGYSNVIFVRMNPGATANNWDNKWNQTADLVIPTDGKNCFTGSAGVWDYDTGSWSTFGGGCAHTYDAGKVTTAATCTTAGVKTYTCSKCQATKTETIKATGHNFVGGTCSACGASQSSTGKVIYFQNTSNWGSVYAYAWSDSTGEYLGTWPGTAMTSEGNGLYSITVPNGADKIIDRKSVV